MSAHDKKAAVLDYINAFNRGDIDGVCRQFAPDALEGIEEAEVSALKRLEQLRLRRAS